jgi:hypothetical protein
MSIRNPIRATTTTKYTAKDTTALISAPCVGGLPVI